MPKNAYFLEKSCKIAATSGAQPRIPIGLQRLGALPTDPRFDFNAKDFNIPPAFVSILTLSQNWQSYHTFSKSLSKNDSILF